MPGPKDLAALISTYQNSTNPAEQRAAYAQLLALQGASGAPPSAPVLAPQMSPAELVAKAQDGRYGTEADPLAMDPSTGQLSPMSVVRRNDTQVTPPPAADPLGGLGAGGAGGPPQMVRISSGSGSTTTHAPEFPKALLPAKRALADQSIQMAEDAAARKDLLLGEQTAQAQLWADQARLERNTAGRAAGATYKRYEEAGKELERGQEAMRQTKLDPGRLWGQMPIAQQAVNTIGIALGGFVEGFTGGKVQNTALKMMNVAIDRDLAAQRDDFARRLEDMNLTAKAQSVLWQQWRSQESDRKAAALRVSQLELTKLGMESQRADVQQRTAEIVLGIKDSLINLEAKTIPKQTKTASYSSRTVPVASLKGMKGAGTEKAAPPGETSKLRAHLTMLRQLNDLGEEYGATDPSRFEALRRTSVKQDAFNRKLKMAFNAYRKEITGAAATVQELAELEKIWQPGLIAGWAPWKSAMSSFRRDAAENAARILQQYPGARGSMLATDVKAFTRDPFAVGGGAAGFGRPQQ